MLSNFEFIHNQFLKNCISHSYLHKQISINGVIELKKPPIKFFSFFCKTIISQQISDKAANKIWDKFCNCLNKKKLDLLSFQRNELYSKLLKIKISKQKTSYICLMYDSLKKNEIEPDKLKFLSDQKIKDKLLKYKGVGNWTCDMILIFFLLRKNIFPIHDLIIKKTTTRICQVEGRKINFKKLFSPYLSIFSLHLWKMAKRILQ